jgi:lipid II:glycine glycyltransferase (peptidoglycan interpeptide bridge formation enzyme)
MTQAGAESRANYLLKWEAIRSSREQGATSYDLWGLATGGIAHFKTGFGGREVRYIGAWDLVLDQLGRTVYEGAGRARVWWTRRRHGLDGGGNASAFGGAEGAD